MEQSRGQIVLVAAFALAIVFVALALILNTAIFTENLATRETTDTHDAIDFHHAVTETADVLLRKTNADESTETTLARTYKTRISNYSDAERAQAIAGGTLRSVVISESHNGTRISQTTDAVLENDSGNSTWKLAGDITDARRVVFNLSAVDSGETFGFNATNGSATWALSVVDTGTDFEVTVDTPHNGTSSRTIADSRVVIAPTNGSIEGEEWPDLAFQTLFPDRYDLWIRNGSNATGTYQLFVDTRAGDLDWPNYDDTTDPRKRPAIYNATLTLDLSRSDLDYRANVTVEPEGRDPR
jgi:hypothetical protein